MLLLVPQFCHGNDCIELLSYIGTTVLEYLWSLGCVFSMLPADVSISKVRAKSAPEILKTTKTTCASIKQYREALETLRSFCIPIGNGPSLKTGKVRSPIGNRARKTKVCSRTRKPQHTRVLWYVAKIKLKGRRSFSSLFKALYILTFKAAKKVKMDITKLSKFPIWSALEFIEFQYIP